MNTVFCIQQKAHRNQPFSKIGNPSAAVSAYGLTKERMLFFCIQKTNSLLCSHKKDKKGASEKIIFGMRPMKKQLFLCQHFTGQIYKSLRCRGKFPGGQSNAQRNGMGRV